MSVTPFVKYFHEEFGFAWRKLEDNLSSFEGEGRAWSEADALLQKRGLSYLRGMIRHLSASEVMAMLAEYEALLPATHDVASTNIKSCLEILHSLHDLVIKHLEQMSPAVEETPVPTADKENNGPSVLKFLVGERLVDFSVEHAGPQRIDAVVEPTQVEAPKEISVSGLQSVEFMAGFFDHSGIWPVNVVALKNLKQKLLHLKEMEGDKRSQQSLYEEVLADFNKLEQRLPCQTVFNPFQDESHGSEYVIGALHFSMIDKSCSLPKQAVGNLLRGLNLVATYLPPTMSKCNFQLAPHLGKRGYVADLFSDEVGFFHWKQICKNLDNSKFGWEIISLEDKCFFRIYLDESVAKQPAFLVKSNDPHFKGVWAIPTSAVKRFSVLGKKVEKIQGPREIKKLPGHNSGGPGISLFVQWKGLEFYLEAQDIVGEEFVTVGPENSVHAPYNWAITDGGRQVIWCDLDLFLNLTSKLREAA